MRDLAKNAEEKQILDFMSLSVSIGRPIATTPGTPGDRVAALRQAFDETLKDAEFLADAERQRLEVRGMTGEQLAQLIKQVIETPAAIREKVKLAIEPTNTTTLPGAKTGNE
jgi:tripartite-type tricarboxylate transporter receptor subunit TctC